MRTTSSTFTLALIAAALVSLGVLTRATPRQAAPGDGYAWADACKSCHADIYEAWSRTKHSRAISRLNSGDQQKDCIGCHVTGADAKVEKDGKFVNGSVQCEACHGPAAAHAADPAVRTGLVRKAPREVCEKCHNSKSPHFRGFYYEGMLAFSHPVPKT
jgi:hypothetical protein